MLSEYNVEQDVLTLYYDNLSAINISKNPIQRSRTNHIDIRHHFIRDLVEDNIVTLEHVATENQLTDIFTKALDASKFEMLRGKLGICLFEDQQQLILFRRAPDTRFSLILLVHATLGKSSQYFPNGYYASNTILHATSSISLTLNSSHLLNDHLTLSRNLHTLKIFLKSTSHHVFCYLIISFPKTNLCSIITKP
jgi:hypothetical protein